MESFLTQQCTITDSSATIPAGTGYTCEYGGVLAYVAIVFFFLWFFSLVYSFVSHLTDRLL